MLVDQDLKGRRGILVAAVLEIQFMPKCQPRLNDLESRKLLLLLGVPPHSQTTGPKGLATRAFQMV